MRFLNPAEVARLADAIGPRNRALVLLGAYGGLRMGELPGLRRSRVDLLRGTVDIAEVVVEVHGQLYSGPPRTRAGRRTVGLPRVVVEELAAYMGPVGPADAYVFTAERAACCGPRTSASRCGCRPYARLGWRRCARTIFGTPRWRCGSRRAPILRRSASGPGTPPSASRWTAAATCSQATILSCATAWTPCTLRGCSAR
jgi:integrase